MAKSPSEKLKRIAKNSQTLVKRLLPADVMSKLAVDMATQLRKRTRLGYGVGNDGKQAKHKQLADSTKEYRKRYKRNLSDQTKPSKSNLTATGQLLDALKGKGFIGRIEIFFNPKQRTKTLSGGKASGLSNSKLKDYVERLRPFFSFTNAEANRFTRTIKTILRQGAKDALLK